MNFCFHPIAQRSIDKLMALYQALAGKCFGYDGRIVRPRVQAGGRLPGVGTARVGVGAQPERDVRRLEPAGELRQHDGPDGDVMGR